MNRRTLLSHLAFTLMLFASVVAPHAARATSSAATDPYFGAIPWELPADAEEMRVLDVHDGDTLRLTPLTSDHWEFYRLIGVNAPEMPGPYTTEQCYGSDATTYLQQLLPTGTHVFIQQDISNLDRYGRYLRHLFWIPDGTDDAYLVSELLVLGGFAHARQYPPDDLYDDVLQRDQDIARNAHVGLWAACPTENRK